MVQEGGAIFLPSQWIHFVHNPVDSIAYASNFIMETHLHQSALAFKKELDAGLARRFLFPNFPGLIVMQLYMEWANKNRASPITKDAMCEMLQIWKLENTAYCWSFHQKVRQLKETNINWSFFFIRSYSQVRSCAMIMVFLMQNGDEIKLREQKII